MRSVGVASTTVGVVDGVHRDSLGLECRCGPGPQGVHVLSGFREGLVSPSSACDDTDGGAAVGAELLDCSGGHQDHDLVSPGDDGSGGSGGLDELTSVPGPGLDVVDEGSLGDVGQLGDVSGDDVRAADDDGLADLGALDCELVVGPSVQVEDREGAGPSGGLDQVLDDCGSLGHGREPHIVHVPVAGRAVQGCSAAPPLCDQSLTHVHSPSEYSDPGSDILCGVAV